MTLAIESRSDIARGYQPPFDMRRVKRCRFLPKFKIDEAVVSLSVQIIAVSRRPARLLSITAGLNTIHLGISTLPSYRLDS
jgi:hypothetical protein